MKHSLSGLKLSRFTGGGLIVLGGCLVVWLVLTLFTGMHSTQTGPARVDPNRCPECGREYPRGSPGECPLCKLKAQAGGKPRPTARPGPARTLATVLVGLFVVLLAVHLAVTLRGHVGKPAEEAYYQTACRKCSRKIRFRESQAGHLAACPLCRAVFRFPELAPTRPWWHRLFRKAARARA